MDSFLVFFIAHNLHEFLMSEKSLFEMLRKLAQLKHFEAACGTFQRRFSEQEIQCRTCKADEKKQETRHLKENREFNIFIFNIGLSIK